MYYVLLVAVGHSREDLLHDDSSVPLAVVRSLDDLVKQLAACAQLCYNEVAFLVLVGLEDLDDVGVVHLLQNLDFSLELGLFLLGDAILLDDLYGALLSGSLVGAFSDLAKSSAADDVVDLVVFPDVMV